MSILNKIVYLLCLASLLCMTPMSVSAMEMSEEEETISIASTVNVNAEAEATTSEEGTTVSQQLANFAISSENGYIGDNVDIDITASPDTAFASARFVLHYDSSKLKYIDYSIPSGSGLNSDNLAKVENTDNGIVYLVLAESSENIQSANITLTFEIIAAGDSDLTLEISDMYAADESEIPAPTDQANGKITGIEKETEPVETTPTIEPTDPETTTTSSTSDDTSNTTTEPSTQEPTSTESSTEPTTQEPTSSSDDTSTTTQPSSSNPNTTKPTSTTNSSATTKTTSTTKATTNQSNGDQKSVPTGDNFPIALLMSALGIACVGLVKTAPRKDK